MEKVTGNHYAEMWGNTAFNSNNTEMIININGVDHVFGIEKDGINEVIAWYIDKNDFEGKAPNTKKILSLTKNGIKIFKSEIKNTKMIIVDNMVHTTLPYMWMNMIKEKGIKKEVYGPNNQDTFFRFKLKKGTEYTYDQNAEKPFIFDLDKDDNKLTIYMGDQTFHFDLFPQRASHLGKKIIDLMNVEKYKKALMIKNMGATRIHDKLINKLITGLWKVEPEYPNFFWLFKDGLPFITFMQSAEPQLYDLTLSKWGSLGIFKY